MKAEVDDNIILCDILYLDIFDQWLIYVYVLVWYYNIPTY